MTYQFPPDVDRLIRDQIASGQYGSEDEVLRDALKALAERCDDLAAIQVGIAEMNAGHVKPLAVVDAAIRKNLGFAPRK